MSWAHYGLFLTERFNEVGSLNTSEESSEEGELLGFHRTNLLSLSPKGIILNRKTIRNITDDETNARLVSSVFVSFASQQENF